MEIELKCRALQVECGSLKKALGPCGGKVSGHKFHFLHLFAALFGQKDCHKKAGKMVGKWFNCFFF